MLDGKDKAIMNASALAGFVLSIETYPSTEWRIKAKELAEYFLNDLSRVYSPEYLYGEDGKITQVK